MVVGCTVLPETVVPGIIKAASVSAVGMMLPPIVSALIVRTGIVVGWMVVSGTTVPGTVVAACVAVVRTVVPPTAT